MAGTRAADSEEDKRQFVRSLLEGREWMPALETAPDEEQTAEQPADPKVVEAKQREVKEQGLTAADNAIITPGT